MSDLWHTCRERLRAQVRPAEWDHCVRFLRAWADGRVVHVWPAQAPHGTATRATTPRLRALIDRTVRDVWAQRDIRVVHDRKSPDRATVVTERREAEHRAEVRARARTELHRFGRECLSECARLAEDPSLVPRLTGDADQRCRQLLGIVESRARKRLDAGRALQFGNTSGSRDAGPAPADPPAWLPRVERTEPTVAAALDVAAAGVMPASEPAARLVGDSTLAAGPEDVRKAIESMPWWDGV